ncbi:MAG TPA: hypothetical protein VJ418_21660 [Streptosporangiaceae bacterium]|nr:hypothetical protein [Streptosporangiaceae bacterium]
MHSGEEPLAFIATHGHGHRFSRFARAGGQSQSPIACPRVRLQPYAGRKERKFRASAQWDNWIKDLTTEQYQLIYEEPIYPKNLYLDRAPYTHAEYRREVIDKQIELMHERDIWRRPDKG